MRKIKHELKVAYFTVCNDTQLFIAYENGSSTLIDLCLLLGLEMSKDRTAKSVYEMTFKQYKEYLYKNRITKKLIIYLLKAEEIYQEKDEKLTLEKLVNKYGDELKRIVQEGCFEL